VGFETKKTYDPISLCTKIELKSGEISFAFHRFNFLKEFNEFWYFVSYHLPNQTYVYSQFCEKLESGEFYCILGHITKNQKKVTFQKNDSGEYEFDANGEDTQVYKEILGL
jgi:hypothetical protein